MRWPWRWKRHRADSEAAQRAARDAERRLREARQDWPQVREAHDDLVEWIETALRGYR